MNRFEQKLAAFQQYVNTAEPKIAPAVNNVIDKYYAKRVGFGDASGIDASQFALEDQATAQGLISPGSASAAVDTSNILSNIVNAGINLVNDQVTMNQQTRILQTEASIAAANAAGSQGLSSTALLAAGAIGFIAIVALMTGKRH